MSERYGFIGDNWYTDAFLAKYISSFIADGVYNLEMQVKTLTDFNVAISMGKGWIKGYYYEIYGTDKILKIDSPDTVMNRIDNVVFYLDYENKTMGTKVVKGTFSANPKPPNLVRTEKYWELKLAEVNVNANTAEITQAMIRDTRLDTNICGIVHCVVDHIDTSTLMADLEDWASNFKRHYQEDFDGWFAAIKAQIEPLIVEAIEATNKTKEATSKANAATELCKEATKAAWEASKGLAIVIDPVDGEEKTVQETLNHIWDTVVSMFGSPLTAEEYDNLNLTAEEYDSKNLTAFEYDTRGKALLIPS